MASRRATADRTSTVQQNRNSLKLSPGEINWAALKEYAIRVKRQQTKDSGEIACQLSTDHSRPGGLHAIRRLDFHDGTSWIARLQRRTPTPYRLQRLQEEAHTIELIRERSDIPVPGVVAYEANSTNAVGVPFLIQEYVPGNTAMDSLGGYFEHGGKTPQQFKAEYHSAMADIQVKMTSIRLPKIGSIVKAPDGTYSVGPMPRFGGPFDTAAEFFKAWGQRAKFPLDEGTIREHTPKEHVDEILKSIEGFPLQLANFAQEHSFMEGPFPLFHTDLFKHNVVVDPGYRVQGVIDWGDAIIAPWELVEFIKDLTIIPPVLDGPLFNDHETIREITADWKEYVAVVKKLEMERHMDNKLSTTLGDWKVQNLAQSCWLYTCDGRIGFYTGVLQLFG